MVTKPEPRPIPRRNCPECRAPADESHCEFKGCPWWRCWKCNRFFDIFGRSMPVKAPA